MIDPAPAALYGSLLLAGLVGSLHCAGMCGPILLAFSQVFRGTSPGASVAMEFACYHGGRIWTYGMLGLGAGWAGQGLREGSALIGWQRPASLAIGGAVVVAGVVLLGIVPGLKLDAWVTGCGVERMRRWSWFDALQRSRGPVARLLLGAVMGLLPCGLVYAMLIATAALPTPLHSALGMLVFGVGTLPSLTAVLLAGRLASRWVRAHGTRIVAISLIVTGCLMVVRTLMVDPTLHATVH